MNELYKWPHEVKTYSPDEVKQYVADDYWQTFRLGLKGKPTPVKLKLLDAYRYNRLAFNSGDGDGNNRNCHDHGVLERAHEVQIDNYINALKRGG